MSYFNADQDSDMRSMSALPLKRRCWCGWFPRGECHSCPADVTCADKLLARCPSCHNGPPPDFTRPLTHRYDCDRARDADAIALGLVDLGGES